MRNKAALYARSNPHRDVMTTPKQVMEKTYVAQFTYGDEEIQARSLNDALSIARKIGGGTYPVLGIFLDGARVWKGAFRKVNLVATQGGGSAYWDEKQKTHVFYEVPVWCDGYEPGDPIPEEWGIAGPMGTGEVPV